VALRAQADDLSCHGAVSMQDAFGKRGALMWLRFTPACMAALVAAPATPLSVTTRTPIIMDTTIFMGTMTEEEFKERHGEEYVQLVADGKLNQTLTAKPSTWLVNFSK
jgi:hypothetical protein